MAFNLTTEIVDKNEQGLFVRLKGELDQQTIQSLKDKLVEAGVAKTHELVFDLSELEFMASAGLSVFVYYHDLFKNKNQQMKIINCSADVMRLFTLTKMNEILHIT